MQSILQKAVQRSDGYLYEYEAYELFKEIGINTPPFKYFSKAQYNDCVLWMKPNQNYVIKCQVPGCLHKTDIKGVVLKVNQDNFKKKIVEFEKNIILSKDQVLEGILLVEMQQFSNQTPTGGELLLSVISDKDFGFLICFGLGGTVVEQMNKMMQDACIFIPIVADLVKGPFRQRVRQMPVTKYLLGEMRGIEKQVSSFEDIIQPLISLQKLFNQLQSQNVQISELEINPIVVSGNKLVALDGVIKATHKVPVLAPKPLYKTGLFIAPQVVLLAGASAKNTQNPCTKVLMNLLSCKSRMQIFCLHPKESEVLGCPAYPSIGALRAAGISSVDLFVVGVAAAAAVEMLREVVDSGFAATNFILTAGFGETEEGKKYEQELRQKLGACRATPDRYPLMNGANTLGYSWRGRVNTVFVDSKKNSAYDCGQTLLEAPNKNVALICQSGACMISRMSDLAGRVQPLFNMSVGNQICMSAVDFLDWMLDYQSAADYSKRNPGANAAELQILDAEKEAVKVFGLYIEGFNELDGQRLLELIPRLKAEGKHVVVYKAARTEQGKHAAAGHTASMSGSYEMCAQILETAGCVISESFQEFEDTLYLISHFTKFQIQTPKLQVGVITNAGFEKCCYADHLFGARNSERYVTLPEFDAATKQKLVEIFGKYKLSSVIDIDQILDTTPTIPDSGYIEFAQLLLDSASVDCVVLSTIPETHMMSTMTGELGAAVGRDFLKEADSYPQLAVKLLSSAKKPVIFVVDSGWKFEPLRQYLSEKGFPVFNRADAAARCINAVARSYIGQW